MAGKDVFVSYSQADRDCAFELVARVEAENIQCWIAPRDISPASDWAAEIIDAIAAARVMVLVFSASSNASAQVRREVERAIHKHVQILPFRIEHLTPSKSLEYFLSSQHWMDAFSGPMDGHYSRLCSYLKTQLMTAPTEAPPAASPAARTFGEASGATDLRHIELELANFIGPIAHVLVKKAAARSSGADDLIASLATELDSAAERSLFVERCRPRGKPGA
jgi:hypothetical protein